MVESLVNYKLERLWEEAAIAYFEVLSLHLPRQTEENHTTLRHCKSKVVLLRARRLNIV
jgi:hypothetical protein